MSEYINLYADVTTFRLVLGSLDDRRSPRSVSAMLALHEDADQLFAVDVDVNPYAVPFYAKFQPWEASLSNESPMPDGCGRFGFVAPFTSPYEDIDSVSASLSVQISLPKADFEALWSTLAVGRPDLVAALWFQTGPFEYVRHLGWRWNTIAEGELRVVQANVVFTAPGWPGQR